MAAKQELLPISEDWHKALAIVAHPDDLEYGAASAIARWTSQGKDIQYLLVTEGEAGIDSMDPKDVGPLRRNEEIASAQVVGVTDVQFLDYKDGVVEYGLPLRRDLTKIIRSKKPDVIITINHELQFAQGQLNMADHRWVAMAAFDAARDAGNRWIFQELLQEGFHPWTGVKMVMVAASPNPTHWVDVSDSIGLGIQSLKLHRAYIENLSEDFDPEMFLSMNANASGEKFGVDYAIEFQVILI